MTEPFTLEDRLAITDVFARYAWSLDTRDVAAFALWNVIAYVVIAALIWFAAKRRKNWARWAYAVVVVLLVGLTILFFSPLPPLWYVLIMGASELLGIISLFYLYSAAASAWFRSPL